MKTPARVILALAASCWAGSLAAQTLELPNRKNSQKFVIIGDAGTGDKEQYAVAGVIVKTHALFPFTFALMLGDNLYGGERPQDFANKFELPYKPLLDDKVEFNAALGNHDDPNQRFYKPFNMGGERYRTYKKGNIRFFILDTNYLDPDQVKWLEKELSASGSDWKIAYFHHPLYTTASRGPELELRKILEPLFVKYGVDVVFSGHEHIYERMWPQKGIQYFTAGGAAKLREGDTHQGDLTEVGFATDRSFMIAEIDGDSMYFQAISGAGKTVDKGIVMRHVGPGAKPDTKTVATTPAATPTIGPATPATAAAKPVVKKPVVKKPVVKKPVVKKPVVKKTTTTTKTTTTKTPVKPAPVTKPVARDTTRKPGTPLAS